METCISTAQARTKCACSYRVVVQEVLPRHLLQRFVQKSCQKILFRDLVREVLPRDLLQRSVRRFCHEIFYLNLAKRTSSTEVSEVNLVQRHCIEIFCGHPLGDLVHRHCIDILSQGFCHHGMVSVNPTSPRGDNRASSSCPGFG